MAREIKPLKDIHVGDRDWTAKVVLLEKGMPRDSRFSPTKFQILIFADAEGNRIQGCIFGSDIHIFKDKLQIGKTYYISKANVKSCLVKHRIVPNPTQWIINYQTRIEEVVDTESLVEVEHSFIPFYRLHEYMDQQIDIDIIGMVIEISPKKQIATRDGLSAIQELSLISEEMKIVRLTMWDQFVRNECAQIAEIVSKKPVIACHRIRVTSFNGFSLSSRLISTFIIDPQFSQAAELYAWYSANKTNVDNLLGNKGESGLSTLSIVPNAEEIISLCDVLDVVEKKRSFWIKAKMKITKHDQNFWYISCDKCSKATPYEYEEKFTCHSCNQDDCKGVPRCRIIVDLIDDTSTISAVIFGRNAEEILGVNALDLMNKTVKGVIQNGEEIAALCNDEALMMHIRGSSNEYNNVINWKYIVLSFYNPAKEVVPLLTCGESNLEKESSSRGKEKVELEYNRQMLQLVETEVPIGGKLVDKYEKEDGSTLKTVEKDASVKSSLPSVKRTLLSDFEASVEEPEGETLLSIKKAAKSSHTSINTLFHLKKEVKKEVKKEIDKKE